MTEHLLDIKITQPGRATGQYHTPDTNTLRLEKIIYPRENLPFDVGILPTALNPFNEPLAALVLGDLSHPINTEMETRLLGALQRNAEAPVLLVAPVVDEHVPHCQDEISAEQRAEITAILHRTYPGKWCWLTVDEVEPELHVSALRFRQRQADGRIPHLDPA